MDVGSSSIELGTEDRVEEAISETVSTGKLDVAGVEGSTAISSDKSAEDESEDTGAGGS